jgi:hypothetical protein
MMKPMRCADGSERARAVRWLEQRIALPAVLSIISNMNINNKLDCIHKYIIMLLDIVLITAMLAPLLKLRTPDETDV